MRQLINSFLLTVLMSMVGVKAFAYDIAVENADGVTICYNYINDGKELEVTKYYYDYYRGNIVIPEEVTYMNRTRKVTSIGLGAFTHCESLTSVTIPNSVTSIGDGAFYECSSLTSVTIPNSVTSIGDKAFQYCGGLTSVIIGNSVTSIGNYAFWGCGGLTSVTIGNSVTSIGKSAFNSCSSLTSVTIGNSVTSIGEWAFYDCETLGSVTIPNSVTSIGYGAFQYCGGLTSVIIGNSVTSIGGEAFQYCRGLTSVTIPNSVTSIGDKAFQSCRGLKSVTIGNSVTSIGDEAFGYIDLPTVISLIENPFEMSTDVFSKNTYNNASLYVPKGTIDKYKSKRGWKDFMFIEEGSGPNSGGETPETKKCAKPTISYQNGKLFFNCDTEGATCQSTITDTDITSYSSNEVQLGVTYHISVYATMAGYENSDVATATLCWIDVDPKTEGINDGIASVRARPILIQSDGNQLIVSGAEEGSAITVFDMAGRVVGSVKAFGESTTINTYLRSGDIGIVKIGDKAIKVMIK